MAERAAIGVANFSAELGGRRVLHAVDFAAGPGEFVAICGPNGAGKTTLLRGLAGLLPGGRVDPLHVAYVEQGARCAWGLTVAELVGLGRIPWSGNATARVGGNATARVGGNATARGGGDATARRGANAADDGAVGRALAACGIAALAERRVDRISGGQARRAMLARALATETPVLLLDEPVADLDPLAAHEVMALLGGLARNGRCVVAVLHAVELAVAYATRMLLLADGRVVADGVPAATLPAAAACFGMGLGVDATARLLAPLRKGC